MTAVVDERREGLTALTAVVHERRKPPVTAVDWYLVRSGTWFQVQVLGTCYLVPAWHQVPGTWSQVPESWSLVPGTWYQVLGPWYQALGTR